MRTPRLDIGVRNALKWKGEKMNRICYLVQVTYDNEKDKKILENWLFEKMCQINEKKARECKDFLYIEYVKFVEAEIC